MNGHPLSILESIDRFHAVRALVIGDVMLDVYDFCSTAESKPIDSEQPGKRAYTAHRSIKVLGGAGNVAANLASLGVSTSLVGITGNDENYFKVRELAETQGISHFLIRDGSRLTTMKMRLYVDGEYLLRRDDEATHKIDKETSATVLNEALHELTHSNVVILSDYNKGIFTADNAPQIIRECRMHNIPVVVDVKPTNRTLFAGADVIVPNENEAGAIVPGFSQNNLEDRVRELHRILGCQKTAVTLGENGVCSWDGATFHRVPGNKVEAVDAVGCGDTVRAALAVGIALGLPLNAAAELANDAAAVIVQKPATALMSKDELTAFISEK